MPNIIERVQQAGTTVASGAKMGGAMLLAYTTYLTYYAFESIVSVARENFDPELTEMTLYELYPAVQASVRLRMGVIGAREIVVNDRIYRDFMPFARVLLALLPAMLVLTALNKVADTLEARNIPFLPTTLRLPAKLFYSIAEGMHKAAEYWPMRQLFTGIRLAYETYVGFGAYVMKPLLLTLMRVAAGTTALQSVLGFGSNTLLAVSYGAYVSTQLAQDALQRQFIANYTADIELLQWYNRLGREAQALLNDNRLIVASPATPVQRVLKNTAAYTGMLILASLFDHFVNNGLVSYALINTTISVATVAGLDYYLGRPAANQLQALQTERKALMAERNIQEGQLADLAQWRTQVRTAASPAHSTRSHDKYEGGHGPDDRAPGAGAASASVASNVMSPLTRTMTTGSSSRARSPAVSPPSSAALTRGVSPLVATPTTAMSPSPAFHGSATMVSLALSPTPTTASAMLAPVLVPSPATAMAATSSSSSAKRDRESATTIRRMSPGTEASATKRATRATSPAPAATSPDAATSTSSKSPAVVHQTIAPAPGRRRSTAFNRSPAPEANAGASAASAVVTPPPQGTKRPRAEGDAAAPMTAKRTRKAPEPTTTTPVARRTRGRTKPVDTEKAERLHQRYKVGGGHGVRVVDELNNSMVRRRMPSQEELKVRRPQVQFLAAMTPADKTPGRRAGLKAGAHPTPAARTAKPPYRAQALQYAPTVSSPLSKLVIDASNIDAVSAAPHAADGAALPKGVVARMMPRAEKAAGKSGVRKPVGAAQKEVMRRSAFDFVSGTTPPSRS
jgi:hypothetical protein